MNIRLLLVAMLFGLPASAQAAEKYECSTLTIVHPYGPGSASAGVMRLVAEELRVKLSVPVIVDYRPGAMGVPSAVELLRAVPNGCTFGILAGIHSSSPWFMKRSPYDPTRDFVPITQIAQFPNVIATSDANMRTFEDFLRIVRSKPGVINVGTMSPGSPDFLTGVLLKDAG